MSRGGHHHLAPPLPCAAGVPAAAGGGVGCRPGGRAAESEEARPGCGRCRGRVGGARCEGLEATRNDILKEAESRRSALLQELGKAWREGQKGRDEAMQQGTDQMRNTLVTLNIATGSDLKKLEKKLSGVTKRLRALEKAYKKELENS